MKPENDKLNLYTISKLINQEILVEELLRVKGISKDPFLKRYNKSKKSWLPAIINGLSFKKMPIPQSLETCDNACHEKEDMVSNEEVIEQIIDFVSRLPD